MLLVFKVSKQPAALLMAYILFKNGTRKIVEPEKALAIWQIMHGEKPSSPRQQAFIKKIERVYLNWRKAPKSYLKDREAIIRDMLSEEKDNFRPDDMWYENL